MELSGAAQIGGIDNHMIVYVMFVDMGADDKGVIPIGEAFGQLHTEAICIFGCDLAGGKRLSQMIGNHVVCAASSAGLFFIDFLAQRELRIGQLAVTLVAGDQLTVIGFLIIFHIIDDISNRSADRSPFADVQRH